MRANARRGQHSAEFAVLMGAVVVVAVGMQTLARRAVGVGIVAATKATLGSELRTLKITADPEVVDIDAGERQTLLRWHVPDGQNCEASTLVQGPQGLRVDTTSTWSRRRDPSSTEPEQVEGLTDTTTFRIACDLPSGERATYAVTVTKGRSEVDAMQAVEQRGRAGLRHRTRVVDSVSGNATGSEIRTQFVTE